LRGGREKRKKRKKSNCYAGDRVPHLRGIVKTGAVLLKLRLLTGGGDGNGKGRRFVRGRGCPD